MTDTLAGATAKVFSQHLHTKFKVHGETPDVLELELTEVVEHDMSPRVECFSVLFSGPRSGPLAQGTKKLDHPTLGTIELFLTPVARDGNNLTYEAIFNRLRPQKS